MTERFVHETYTKEVRRKHYDQNARQVDDSLALARGRDFPAKTSYDRFYIHDPQPTQLRHLTDLVYTLIRDLRREKEFKPVEKFDKVSGTSEIDELKRAIAELSEKVGEIQENKKKSKEMKNNLKVEKGEKKKKERIKFLDAQIEIRDELEKQRTLLKDLGVAQRESDRILRDDIADALKEFKQQTDDALSDHKEKTGETIKELAIKVSDLVSDNYSLRAMVEELGKTLQSFYVDDSDDEIKRAPSPMPPRKSQLFGQQPLEFVYPQQGGKRFQQAGNQYSGHQQGGNQHPGYQHLEHLHHEDQHSGFHQPGQQHHGNQQPGNQQPGHKHSGNQHSGYQQPGHQQTGIVQPNIQQAELQQSRCSSSSSGSVAMVLPPAIVTDGRRPSQAYHIHTLKLAEEVANESAKKALEEATRINVSKM